MKNKISWLLSLIFFIKTRKRRKAFATFLWAKPEMMWLSLKIENILWTHTNLLSFCLILCTLACLFTLWLEGSHYVEEAASRCTILITFCNLKHFLSHAPCMKTSLWVNYVDLTWRAHAQRYSKCFFCSWDVLGLQTKIIIALHTQWRLYLQNSGMKAQNLSNLQKKQHARSSSSY